MCLSLYLQFQCKFAWTPRQQELQHYWKMRNSWYILGRGWGISVSFVCQRRRQSNRSCAIWDVERDCLPQRAALCLTLAGLHTTPVFQGTFKTKAFPQRNSMLVQSQLDKDTALVRASLISNSASKMSAVTLTRSLSSQDICSSLIMSSVSPSSTAMYTSVDGVPSYLVFGTQYSITWWNETQQK